jgi:hypothetical protein
MPKRKQSAEVADSSTPFKHQVLQQADPERSRFSDTNKMELRSRSVTKNVVGGLGSVRTARFVEELLGRGVRMVIFDFDGVMHREHGKCRHIMYIHTFLFCTNVYLIFAYGSFPGAHSLFWQLVQCAT